MYTVLSIPTLSNIEFAHPLGYGYHRLGITTLYRPSDLQWCCNPGTSHKFRIVWWKIFPKQLKHKNMVTQRAWLRPIVTTLRKSNCLQCLISHFAAGFPWEESVSTTWHTLNFSMRGRQHIRDSTFSSFFYFLCGGTSSEGPRAQNNLASVVPIEDYQTFKNSLTNGTYYLAISVYRGSVVGALFWEWVNFI